MLRLERICRLYKTAIMQPVADPKSTLVAAITHIIEVSAATLPDDVRTARNWGCFSSSLTFLAKEHLACRRGIQLHSGASNSNSVQPSSPFRYIFSFLKNNTTSDSQHGKMMPSAYPNNALTSECVSGLMIRNCSYRAPVMKHWQLSTTTAQNGTYLNSLAT